MDFSIHTEFLRHEDQEAGGTANCRRNKESRALLGEASSGMSYCRWAIPRRQTAAEPTAKQRWSTGMPWKSSRPLPDIPTRWTTVHREVGGPGPCGSAAWGSWEHDGKSARVLLGATAEKVN